MKYSSVQEMLSVQQLIHNKEKHGKAHDHFIGLGFNIINPATCKLVGHEGESFGFMSSIWVDPEAGTGYLFAWNTTYRLPNKKDEKLFAEFNKTVYENLFR